jgi:phenylpropionate dioxygenase-like ring-hydroxylating dioxygenase large terminal subunit
MSLRDRLHEGDAEAPLGAAILASGIQAADDGPVRIPTERYTSPAFFTRELSMLWPRVWVIACSVDHVGERGDFYELRFGPYSVVIVRGDDGELRAFQNVCRHRGNALCQGSGSGLTELRCGYHRWAWTLDGRLREVPSRKGFGVLRNDDFPLLPVQVDTFGRLVFVNLDTSASAPSLMEWLEGVPADIAWAKLDEFRCLYMTRTVVPCNWKVVSDGFSETYHVQGLHREMLASINDVEAPQKIWDLQGASYQDYAVPSPRLGRTVDDRTVWDSFVQTQGDRMGPEYSEAAAIQRGGSIPMPTLAAGQTMQDLVATKIREHWTTRGVDLSGYSVPQLLRMSQYNLFPNSTFLVNADLYSVLSARPGPAVDEAEFVMFYFERAPSPVAPRSRPVDVAVPMERANFGFVISADVRVMPGIQVGLRQPGLDAIVLSREECRIINMHRHLERFLGLLPGDRLSG